MASRPLSSRPRRFTARRAAAAAALALVLAGCATGPRAPVLGPAPVPAPPPARVEPPPPSPLVTEQRWLQQWFGGTPVVIAMQDDGVLHVEVPLVHAFDAERSAVKPALGAVLDRVATSMLRQQATRVQISAPGETSALGLARAASVREHLAGKGVRPHRIGTAAAPAAAPVQLRLVIAPAAVSRVDDARLPPPPSSLPAKPPAAR